jgi:hypothetical protein
MSAIMHLLIVTEGPTARVREAELLARFPERTALLATKRWVFSQAMARAFELMVGGRWTHFLLLGKRAASAFGLDERAKPLHWYDSCGVRIAVLPLSAAGASGRDVRSFLRELLRESRAAEIDGARESDAVPA